MARIPPMPEQQPTQPTNADIARRIDECLAGRRGAKHACDEDANGLPAASDRAPERT